MVEDEHDNAEHRHRETRRRRESGNGPARGARLFFASNDTHGVLKLLRVPQRARAMRPRQISIPVRDPAAPAYSSGVSYRNVTVWSPAGTTTARTSALARMMGS